MARLLPVCIILAFIWITLSRYFPGEAADVLALWYAGQAYADGRFGDIYAKASDLFYMLPPDAWVADRQERGIERALYPFIYPPIWAWVMSGATQVMSMGTMLFAITLINATALLGMFALTFRIFRAQTPFWAWLLFGIGIGSITFAFMIAQVQNQPQIIVAFLTVLAIERSFANRPAAAGIAMAIAASIKLYPLIFALLWLFSGRRSEAIWFFVSGAILALVSIAIVGWPLHAEFFAHVSAISNTALLTSLTHAFDPMIAQLLYPGAFIEIIPDFVAAEDEVKWAVAPKPLWHTVLNKIVLIAFIIAASRALRNETNPVRERALWPVLMAIFGLIGPISWSYHYLAVLAFLPLFLTTLAGRKDWTVFAVCIAGIGPLPYLISWANERSFNITTPVMSPVQIVATLAIVGLTFLFWRNLQRSGTATHG